MSRLPYAFSLLGFAFAVGACSSNDSGSNVTPDAAADSSTTSDAATVDSSSDASTDGASDASHDGAADTSTPTTEAGADGGGCAVAVTPVGTGTLTGTLDGNATMAVTDVSVVLARTSPGAGPWILTIGFHDFAHSCGYLENAATPSGSNSDSIVIQTTSEAATSPFTVGTYPQASLTEEDAGSYTYDISVDVEAFDTTCSDNASRGSTTGSVILTNAGPTEVAGSYDLTLQNGHITGTFDAPICTAAPPGTTRACCP
jgi:hypothetical protein